MLKSLHIENYAIIDSLDMDFSESLNIITGETGAGKSIMLGAISLILGKRADTKVLNDQSRKCIVEAIFTELSKETFLFLEQEGFDTDSELIIRREISPTGKSRAFINDTPSNLKNLEKISENLIDLNRQFELLDIQQANFHQAMIDNLAGIVPQVSAYQSEYFDFRKKATELKTLKASDSQAAKEFDFLKFQYNELNILDLQPGDQIALESDLAILSKSEDVFNLTDKTIFNLSLAEPSLKDQIRELSNEWESMAELNPIFKALVHSLQTVDNELDEIVRLADEAKDSIDVDPSKRQEIDDRLNLIYSLLNKHRLNDGEELMELYNRLGEQLNSYQSRDEQIVRLEKVLEKQEKELRVRAEKLSVKRKKAFKPLLSAISKILESLSMGSAKVDIEYNNTETLTANGIDDIEILFSANKGSELLPIKQVASGGELSRLMLAMKSTVAHQMKLPTLIFDEIDTGVSGDVAQKMGDLMRSLGENHQVISITHSPQVAARANKHFHIFKEETKDKTFTRMRELSIEERITEIAQMLSGANPSSSAISNARELLDIS